VTFIALSVIPLIVFNVFVTASIRDQQLSERKGALQINAVIMSESVRSYGLENLRHAVTVFALQSEVTIRSNNWGVRILVIDEGGRVIADSSGDTLQPEIGNVLFDPVVFAALGGNDTTILNEHAYFLYSAATVLDGERRGAVLLVESVEGIFESLSDIRTMLLLYSLAVGILVVVLVIITSYRLITPLREIMRVVQRMSTGQLSLRIPTSERTDEYTILGNTFNNMTEKLEQVEKTREEFVSNVSHELKTPLSSVKVLSESILLQDSVPEAMYREFLQDITGEVDRMTNIINDLLALVKVDQREQGLNIQPMVINQLVEDILKRLAPLAEQKKVVLLYEEVRPVQIDADEIKLSLAISNIVENGIKYTPGGGTVKVVVDSDHQFAFITVQDTGIGIPEEEQDKIFNRFYRVDKARDRGTGGTGLGLAISKSTVLLHNGNIRVTSAADEGSVFIIRIPLRRT